MPVARLEHRLRPRRLGPVSGGGPGRGQGVGRGGRAGRGRGGGSRSVPAPRAQCRVSALPPVSRSVLEPLGRFAEGEGAERYPAVRCGEFVNRELEAISLRTGEPAQPM